MSDSPDVRITERARATKTAKRRLEHDSEITETVLESTNEGFVVWDSKQKLVAWSNKCPDFWYEPENILRPGMPMVELLRHIATKGGFGPGDTDKLARRELRRIRKAGTDSEDEFQMRDGRIIYVQRNSMPDGGHASTYTDITERRRAEAALQESEEQYRSLVEGSIQGVVIDRDGVPLFANQAYADIFGYDSPNDILTLETLAPLYETEERKRVAQYRKNRMAGCQPAPEWYEFRGLKKDGSKIRLETRLHMVTWQGNPAIQSTVIDITELQAAKEARERFSQAVETVPVGIALFDSDDRLVFFNSRYGKLMEVMADILKPGVTFEKMIRTMVERQPVKDARGREEEFIQERIKHHRNPTGPFDIRRDNMWLSADETRLSDGSIFTIIIDITERKQTESELEESREQLRAVFDNTPVCLNLKDTEGRYILVNKPYEEWLGRPAEEIIGKKASEFLGQKEEVKILTQAERQVLETGEVVEREVSVSRPDGNVYKRILIKFPVKSADGSIAAIGTVAVDITERKRMEEALVESEKRHRHFSADVAHELRTPLAVLRSHLDNLEDTETNQSLIQDVDAMSRLVSQLLATTRLDSLTVNPNDEADLHAIGIEVAKNLAPFAIKEGRSIEVNGTQNPVMVRGNDDALKMAVRNLVENALRYSAQNTVVTINVSDEPAISVINHGLSIQPEQKKEIFQRFKRADRRSDGAGLGLSIVQRVVEAHQATIDVSDVFGGGAVFKISFPSHKNRKVVAS